MRTTTVIIIGAGQAGLAMSYHLSRRAVDHVLLERGEIANSWRTERWDSLRLLTPNWQSRLPGHEYSGDEPDGFRTMPEIVEFIDLYAAKIGAPVETSTDVLSVHLDEGRYVAETTRGRWRCRCVVIASGACNIASKPPIAQDLTPRILSLTPLEYRNPHALPEGGVLIVGASATGVQIAQELQCSGRQVTLAAGEHVRACRTYRGRDIQWWMDACGVLDTSINEVDDIKRARNVPSMQLVGTPTRKDIDLNVLQELGVTVTGRLAGLSGSKAQFSGGLANVCRLADLKLNRLLSTIDKWIAENDIAGAIGAPERIAPTRVSEQLELTVDLVDRGIRTVLWATGYRPNYSWLNVPVLDRKGLLRHEGGVVDAPGMYVLGLPFLRRRKSNLIDGVGGDARDLAAHLQNYLGRPDAAAA